MAGYSKRPGVGGSGDVGPGVQADMKARRGPGRPAVNPDEAVDAFGALGDPTRRQIVELLVDGGPSTATALAGRLDITRQAVAKHLQLLAEAGIASSERVGRETRFQADTEGFDAVRQWIDRVEGEWANRLARMAASVEGRLGPDGERD